MSSHVINDDEWNALAGESPEAYKVYGGLRRVMDYQSGIVGVKRRVNEQFFRDLLTVDPIPGRQALITVSRGKFRNIIKRLESIGLITPMRGVGPFVFKLNLATTDYSVKNQVSRGTTNSSTTATTEQRPEESQKNQSTCDTATTKQQPEQQPTTSLSSNPLPVSGYIDIYIHRQQLHDALKNVVPELWLVRAKERKLIGEWLALGIGSDVLNEAIDKANHALPGERYSLPYLDPIIRQLLFEKKQSVAVVAKNGKPNVHGGFEGREYETTEPGWV